MIRWFPYGENTLTVSIKQPLEDQYQSQSWEHFCIQMSDLDKINLTQGEEESLKVQGTHQVSFFLITNLIIAYLIFVSHPVR